MLFVAEVFPHGAVTHHVSVFLHLHATKQTWVSKIDDIHLRHGQNVSSLNLSDISASYWILTTAVCVIP